MKRNSDVWPVVVVLCTILCFPLVLILALLNMLKK